MGKENDIQVVRTTQATNENAWAQATLYNTFSKAMFNICLRMTGSRPRAEDILHDAFVIAFKNMAQLKQPEAAGGWLRRIVVNECIRQIKGTIRWNDLAEDDEIPANDSTAWWEGIGLDLLHREIKALPDGCRQVFVLYALEDYGHKEIAASLGITEGTSKSQYHRSRALLKERILKQMKLTNG